ncbi:9-divinyl ether synthase [Hibiscus syriacus]|uniref:9-divinyl ether synthase n=1 Tax=Hibiscus syriacus TaxID=106335 RepID=A0A6A3CW26_HIBSY|nr:9-divinyl ether synthase [Hibiscus syriacus]
MYFKIYVDSPSARSGVRRTYSKHTAKRANLIEHLGAREPTQESIKSSTGLTDDLDAFGFEFGKEDFGNGFGTSKNVRIVTYQPRFKFLNGGELDFTSIETLTAPPPARAAAYGDKDDTVGLGTTTGTRCLVLTETKFLLLRFGESCEDLSITAPTNFFYGALALSANLLLGLSTLLLVRSVFVLPPPSVHYLRLAMDLLVASMKAERIGYLDDLFVLPCVGNDAYTLFFTATLLFLSKGRMVEFVKYLANFAAASGKKHVVMLSSLDFGKWQKIDMSR